MEEKIDHKIYKYTNKVNGKVYIGRTCMTLRRRAKKSGIGYRHCTYFWNAIKKYGWDNFEPAILEENLNAEEAAEREIFYIEQYDSTDQNKGYNIIDSDYLMYSDEHRKKISQGNIGQEVSEETRNKIRNALKGRKLPKEVCDKMSASRKGHVVTEETRQKIRKASLGKKVSPEAKKKMSEAKIGKYVGENSPSWGRKVSDYTKQKLREANLGRVVSDEQRKKISERLTGKPTWNKGKKMSKEYCERLKGFKSANRKAVICVETNVEYESISEASKLTGIRLKNISCALCSGEKYTAGGFHWKYKVDPKEFVPGRRIVCVETGVEYNSIVEAFKLTGIKKSNLSMALRSKRRAGGFHWNYKDED